MPSPTILVLDPNRELAEMAGEVLAARGYDVAVAEHLDTAFDVLRKHPSIRIAVCHATLPVIDGSEDVPILDELASRGGIGLVVISSRPFEDVPNVPEGAVKLLKPFGAGELLDAIARAMQTPVSPPHGR